MYEITTIFPVSKIKKKLVGDRKRLLFQRLWCR